MVGGPQRPVPARSLAMSRRRLVGAGLALLAGLALAEVVARRVFADEVDPELIRRAREAQDVSPLVGPSSDPRLVFASRPGLDLRLPGWRVVTDERGLRVRTRPRREPRPEGTPLRVVVLGASGSFGLGVPAEASWPHVMADRLEPALQRPVEVLNLSVTAYVSSQQARLFELHGLAWQPDLVVWHYDHRDAYPVDLLLQPLLPPEVGDNPLRSALLKLVLRRWRQAELREALWPDDVPLSAEGYPRGGAGYDAHLAALQGVAAACRAQDVPVALFLFDTFVESGEPAQRHSAELHAPLVPRLAAAGFHVFDLLPFLLATMGEQGWTDLSAWWRSVEPRDGHYNTEGHAWLGERLAAWLTGDAALLQRARPN
jgi:hypothetical protein